MAESEKEDRSEAASATRLVRAREQGQVAVSRELQTLGGLAIGVFTLIMTMPGQVAGFVMHMRALMQNTALIDVSAGGSLMVVRAVLLDGAGLAAPVVLAAAAATLVIGLLQTGFLFHLPGLLPKPERINPMHGLSRIFGGQTAIDGLKSLAKFAAFAFAVWHVISGLPPLLARAPGWEVATLASRMARLAFDGALLVLAVQAVIALLDLLHVRFKHMTSLRMSRQELRDEHRENEGNPQVKNRLRQLRRQRANRRMMAQVPKATVVVTNPTHYAVALVYENGSKAAPRLVAKGADELAARIREVALDNRVPVVSNPPLARALYTLPLDAEIPREHFQAVAGIIAYVWRLRRPRPGPPPVR